MEALPKGRILEFNPDTLEAVRVEVGLDKPGRIDEAVDILDDWIQKQSHFNKKHFPREYLERTVIIAKGLLERAKQRMDKLCTFRTLMPELFTKPNVYEFTEFNHLFTHAHLPKLTKEHHRVYILKVYDQDFNPDIVFKFYKNLILIMEYLKKNDYSSSFQLILDYRDANIMTLVTKVNPLDLKQIMTVMTEGYGMRIKGIHLITSSKMVDTLIALLKQVISAKLASRMYVHKTLHTLYDSVSKDVLPIEYGGEEKSLKEINVKWLEVISSQGCKEYFEEMLKANTNESCRQSNNFNEEYAGMPGSFRGLAVD